MMEGILLLLEPQMMTQMRAEENWRVEIISGAWGCRSRCSWSGGGGVVGGVAVIVFVPVSVVDHEDGTGSAAGRVSGYYWHRYPLYLIWCSLPQTTACVVGLQLELFLLPLSLLLLLLLCWSPAGRASQLTGGLLAVLLFLLPAGGRRACTRAAETRTRHAVHPTAAPSIRHQHLTLILIKIEVEADAEADADAGQEAKEKEAESNRTLRAEQSSSQAVGNASYSRDLNSTATLIDPRRVEHTGTIEHPRLQPCHAAPSHPDSRGRTFEIRGDQSGATKLLII